MIYQTEQASVGAGLNDIHRTKPHKSEEFFYIFIRLKKFKIAIIEHNIFQLNNT